VSVFLHVLCKARLIDEVSNDQNLPKYFEPTPAPDPGVGPLDSWMQLG